jgi:hypothetical protein
MVQEDRVPLLCVLLLAVFSSKISSGANRTFGEEVLACYRHHDLYILLTWSAIIQQLNICIFLAARSVSEDIGAQLVLGDRPIEIIVCGYLIICTLTLTCFEAHVRLLL